MTSFDLPLNIVWDLMKINKEWNWEWPCWIIGKDKGPWIYNYVYSLFCRCYNYSSSPMSISADISNSPRFTRMCLFNLFKPRQFLNFVRKSPRELRSRLLTRVHLMLFFSPVWDLIKFSPSLSTLQWRHNERHGVSNHQPHDCLLNRLFKVQIKENIKAPRHWPLWREFAGDLWIPRTKGQ